MSPFSVRNARLQERWWGAGRLFGVSGKHVIVYVY